MRIAFAFSIAASLCAVATLTCSSDTPEAPARIDTDGDGLSDVDEAAVYGTSPLLADTDGDGLSDFTEVVELAFDPASDATRFNPLVADLPKLEVRVVAPPVITLSLTTASGESRSFDTSRSNQTGTSTTNGDNASQSQSDTVSTSTPNRAPAALDGGASDAGGGNNSAPDASDGTTQTPTNAPDPSSTVTLATNVDRSASTSADVSQSYSETLSAAESFSQSQLITASSGTLTVSLALHNRGHVAFRVVSLFLTATIDGPDSTPMPIGNLVVDAPDYSQSTPFTLAPNETLPPVAFSRTSLSIEVAESLLRDPTAVRFAVGAYELQGATSKPYAFDETAILAKTALFIIDDGDAALSYRIATHADPAKSELSAHAALASILRLRVFLAKDGTLEQIGEASSRDGRWSIAKTSSENGTPSVTRYGENNAPYPFDAITARSGDALTFTRAAR